MMSTNRSSPTSDTKTQKIEPDPNCFMMDESFVGSE